MKKIFSILLLFALICQGLSAQTFREWLQEKPDRAAYIYHNYESGDTHLTTAPSGFKPFYISHYGRHGSRYHTSDVFFRNSIPYLEKCDSANILTSDGKQLLADLKALRTAHEGMYGFLTQIGSRQHKEIAAHMYNNFPEVFKQKDRTQIMCISSPFPRCIQSMANFTISLGSNTKGIDFHYYTGDKYFDIIANQIADNGISALCGGIRDSLLNVKFFPDRLAAKTFTDTEAAAKLLGCSFSKLFLNVFDSACIVQDIEGNLNEILPYFTIDELYALSYAENTRMYADWYTCTEVGDSRSKGIGAPLLNDILVKADAAVAGNDIAADLRFGHDSGLSPLMSFIGLNGNDCVVPIAQSTDHWFCGREMCMASNLQMIFYRNRSGEVLVKFLHNEAEATIAAVPAFEGPYYRWADIRAYFVKLLQD